MSYLQRLMASAVGVGAVIALVLFLSSFTTVSASQRALVLHFGAFDGQVLEPGFHWLTPFRDSVEKMDVSTQKVEAAAEAATQDLQDVHSTVAVNFNLDEAYVGDIYLTFRGDHADRLIAPALQESIKATTAKYTAEQLVTKRSEVRDDIRRLLVEKLAPHHIVVGEFNITNFSFSPSFNKAIEAKVTAEQDALTEKNNLETKRFLADQRIEEARGEAEAIKIQAQAINSQGGADYVNLQAIAKWDGHLPQQFVPGSAIPFLNLK